MKNIVEVIECYRRDPINSCKDEVLKAKKDSIKRYTEAEADVFDSDLRSATINDFNALEYLMKVDRYEFRHMNEPSVKGPRVYTRKQFYKRCLNTVLVKYGDITLEELSNNMPTKEYREILSSLMQEQSIIERIDGKNR